MVAALSSPCEEWRAAFIAHAKLAQDSIGDVFTVPVIEFKGLVLEGSVMEGGVEKGCVVEGSAARDTTLPCDRPPAAMGGGFEASATVWDCVVTVDNTAENKAVSFSDDDRLHQSTVLKVARNEVENASLAQRSAHRDSRIWRLELIEPAAERKRRASGRRPTFKSAFPDPQILPQCKISSNYPYNVWFFLSQQT